MQWTKCLCPPTIHMLIFAQSDSIRRHGPLGYWGRAIVKEMSGFMKETKSPQTASIMVDMLRSHPSMDQKKGPY